MAAIEVPDTDNDGAPNPVPPPANSPNAASPELAAFSTAPGRLARPRLRRRRQLLQVASAVIEQYKAKLEDMGNLGTRLTAMSTYYLSIPSALPGALAFK